MNIIDDKQGKEETEKFLDTMSPSDTTSGFKPIPVTCPKCGNYKNNIRIGISVKVVKMPERKLYKCNACEQLFNDPPQPQE